MTFLFLCCGLILLVMMVWQVGITTLLPVFQALGWWIGPFLLLEMVLTLCHTAGWAACFWGPRIPLGFWPLWLVRLAGSAINQLTPTATLGGEVVRVLLLETALPRDQAMAAVVIGKATVTIAQMFYLALGTLYVMQHLALPSHLQWGIGLMIALVSLGLLGFVALQRYGLLATFVRYSERLPLRCFQLPSLWVHLRKLDAQLVAYYTAHPWRFIRSLAFHCLGFLLGSVKTYILLHLLLGNRAPDLAGALKVTVAVDALDQLFFFVPARLGTLEGVRFTVLSHFGVAQVYGLAFGLIVRLEQLVWSGLGLLAYGLCTRYPAWLQSRHGIPSPLHDVVPERESKYRN